jgi:hypothetical protein
MCEGLKVVVAQARRQLIGFFFPQRGQKLTTVLA